MSRTNEETREAEERKRERAPSNAKLDNRRQHPQRNGPPPRSTPDRLLPVHSEPMLFGQKRHPHNRDHERRDRSRERDRKVHEQDFGLLCLNRPSAGRDGRRRVGSRRERRIER